MFAYRSGHGKGRSLWIQLGALFCVHPLLFMHKIARKQMVVLKLFPKNHVGPIYIF